MNLFGEVMGAKPFLKWAGGKRQLIPTIQAALPKDFSRTKDITYVEPFIGGGAVLFWMLQTYTNIRKAIINDINPDLTIAYEVVRDQPGKLIASLSEMQENYFTINTEDKRRQFFEAAREEFNTRQLTHIRNTVLLIFLNRTCFNGLYRVNSKNKFNVPFGSFERPQICDAQTLIADSQLLQRVEILNGDFAETLNFVRRRAFFYFDPPYKPVSQTANFNSYASEAFNDASQERLAAFCRKLDVLGHAWMLSNSDVKDNENHPSYFDALYEGFLIQRVKAKRNINSKGSQRGEVDEILVTNNARELMTSGN